MGNFISRTKRNKNKITGCDGTEYTVEGTHEVQECLEGQSETDLHKHLANCKKNPSHLEFVPVNKFTVEHLPSGYHDMDIYELTKVVADLTVRIAVKFTSPERPEFVPDSQVPYPCYKNRGNNSLRTGTGWVCDVQKFTEEFDPYIDCPCPECDHSDTTGRTWWKVDVLTAKHVVFDLIEAKQSTCRLWYDDDKSPVVKIYGWEVTTSTTENDLCNMWCVTHDLEIGDKLEKMYRRFNNLCRTVNDNYESRRDVDKLTIIVSHPHGCSKQVSVGHWVHRQKVGYNRSRYTYTTCTCPGSSGAWVYCLGSLWPAHPHSGAYANGLNYSGVEWK